MSDALLVTRVRESAPAKVKRRLKYDSADDLLIVMPMLFIGAISVTHMLFTGINLWAAILLVASFAAVGGITYVERQRAQLRAKWEVKYEPILITSVEAAHAYWRKLPENDREVTVPLLDEICDEAVRITKGESSRSTGYIEARTKAIHDLLTEHQQLMASGRDDAALRLVLERVKLTCEVVRELEAKL